MGPSSFPSHLVALLSSGQTGTDSATDALEEWILHRRTKGDTLFDVSVGLAELEDKTPPHLTSAFDRARYVTNIPQPTDLTPPTGPFPLARSASTATIMHHLLSQPPPSIEHSREVILEYVLAREAKHKEKKPGRGGKGTLGRDGFEDIGRRLGEVEDGLKGDSMSSGFSPKRGSTVNSTASPRDAYPTPRSDTSLSLNENQQVGLALILSLRMSLSYFSLQEVASQLLLLALGDAERTLVQHIRRRVQGEGRWGVGKELEHIEGLTLNRRPALRPAFRSAKARTLLPDKPLYPIQLPAPGKSACIKLISSLAKEVEAGGPVTAAGTIQSQFPAGFSTPGGHQHSPSADRSYFLSKRGASSSPTTTSAFRDGSPQTPLSSLPPPLHSPGVSSFNKNPTLPDPNLLANYTLELVSEFLTREKREHILKSKWAKSGRDQLSKDLAEIETAVCLIGKNKSSSLTPVLVPVFLLLRRTFALPPSTLHPSITDPYLDILPAPPDPDNVPFREPSVGITTASLYVNPRLDDAAAMTALEELVEFEKENVQSDGATREETVNWLVELVDSVQKRFPDGSYEAVFAAMRDQIAKPAQLSTPVASSVAFAKQPSVHRRVKSSAVTPGSEASGPSMLSTPNSSSGHLQHSRSLSMPNRRSTYDESDSDSSDLDDSPAQAQIQMQTQPRPAVITSVKQLPPLQMLSPIDMDERKSSAGGSASVGGSSGGWWDIVSAMDNDNPAPWQAQPEVSRDRPTPAPMRQTTSSGQASTNLPLPPGAEPAQILDFSAPMLTDMGKLELGARPSTPSRSSFGQTASQTQPQHQIQSLPPPPASAQTQGHAHTRMQTQTQRSPPISPPQIRAQTLKATSGSGQGDGHTAPVQRHGPRSAGPGFGGYFPPYEADNNSDLPPVPPLRYDRPSPSHSPGASYSGASTPLHSPQTSTGAPSPIGNVSSPSALASSSSPAAAGAGMGTPTPAPTTSHTRHKLGVIGRSMSLARHKKEQKEQKEKEKEKEKLQEKEREKENESGGRKMGKVQNNPGKWDKNMVANIMGPPAQR